MNKCLSIIAASIIAIQLTSLDKGRAEYRVFLLQISKKPKPSNTAAANDAEKKEELPPPRIFKSTLDPEQYKGYYPIQPDEQITYSDTWMCRGRTDGMPLCDSPRTPASVANP